MRSKEEHYTQCAIVDYIRYKDELVFAIPNGGSRNKIEAANLKREGVLAGVSDLILVYPGRIVFVEVKSRNGKLQESQKLFRDTVQKLGYEYIVIRSLDEFITWEKVNE